MKQREQNPYNLTPEQLADVEITKAQVAEHLKTIDFSKMETQRQVITTDPEIERQANRVLSFTTLINPKNKARGVILPREKEV